MTKEETLQILAVLRASYPTEYMNLTAEGASGVVGVWSMHFADVPVDIVLMALNKWVSTNKKSPTVADINEKLKTVHWDAVSMIEQSHTDDTISADEVNACKRIYLFTERYKFPNRIEPTIRTMIGTNVKQIGGAE